MATFKMMKDPTDNQLRIHGYILKNPGVHYSKIRKDLEINNGAATYDLMLLEKRGWLMKKHDGQRTVYYARWNPEGHHERGSLVGPNYEWERTPGSSRISSMT
jgi:predicted transcriptional regulator